MRKKSYKKHNKPNGYPLPEKERNVVVMYDRKKFVKPIPEVGKKYHCYDDGKITFSRHFIIEVNEVLGHQAFKKKYPEKFQEYRERVKDCYWLYSTHSDKFIITKEGENNELGVYVRTKDGGWFGVGDYFNCALLDVTGEISRNLLQNIDNFEFDEGEKERMVKEFEI